MLLESIDKQALQKCTQLTHWLQARYHRDNFWLAYHILALAVCGSFIWLPFAADLRVLQHSMDALVALSCIAVSMLYYVLIHRWVWPAVKRTARAVYADAQNGVHKVCEEELLGTRKTALLVAAPVLVAFVLLALTISPLWLSFDIVILAAMLWLWLFSVTPFVERPSAKIIELPTHRGR